MGSKLENRNPKFENRESRTEADSRISNAQSRKTKIEVRSRNSRRFSIFDFRPSRSRLTCKTDSSAVAGNAPASAFSGTAAATTRSAVLTFSGGKAPARAQLVPGSRLGVRRKRRE